MDLRAYELREDSRADGAWRLLEDTGTELLPVGEAEGLTLEQVSRWANDLLSAPGTVWQSREPGVWTAVTE